MNGDIISGNNTTKSMKLPKKILKLKEQKPYKAAAYIDYQSNAGYRAPDNDNCLIQRKGLLMTRYQFTLMILFHPEYTEKAETDFSLLIFTSNGIEKCSHKITHEDIEIPLAIAQHPLGKRPAINIASPTETSDTAPLLNK